MNPASNASAIGAAKMKPRLSTPATWVIPCPRHGATMATITSVNSPASARTGVTS